jgi:hypothetical protein
LAKRVFFALHGINARVWYVYAAELLGLNLHPKANQPVAINKTLPAPLE